MAYIPTKIFTLPQGSLAIQSALVTDAEEFVEIIEQTRNETDFLAQGPGRTPIDLEDERKFIEDKIKNHGELLITARLNGVMTGTLGFSSSSLLRYRHKGSFGISVRKDYWGLGIGRRLIDTLFAWADANGIVKITLEVDTLNSRAIGLYRSLGFVEEGLEKMDRRMENGQFRDSFLMARFNPYYSRKV